LVIKYEFLFIKNVFMLKTVFLPAHCTVIELVIYYKLDLYPPLSNIVPLLRGIKGEVHGGLKE